MMFPNENYIRYFQREELPEETPSGRSGCIRYGTFLVFSQTERELEKLQLLRDALGDFVIDHVTTRMHKTILGAFGIDANVLRN
ncbi:hypothetical protein [Sharpea porci]|uniref:hypothetical protein n=1 Tax=Sharpea porci TaxID=2652286 RepID=UPI002A914950|nr:hypothetical protein [Sharpea porci]MDY5278254.1 hypothetical protein [Sharpea porci]